MAGGRVCVISTALGGTPSTGGGRPPAGKPTTPEGYLKRGETEIKTVYCQDEAQWTLKPLLRMNFMTGPRDN